jgi:hypothetical protein
MVLRPYEVWLENPAPTSVDVSVDLRCAIDISLSKTRIPGFLMAHRLLLN